MMTNEQEPTQPIEGPTGGGGEEPKSKKKRIALLLISVVALVLIAGIGVAGYIAWRLLPSGEQPEAALPADSTVALLTFDGDPSASQKIAALKLAGQFPELKKQLGGDSSTDLRKFAFDKAFQSNHCSFTFDKDVKPWIGKRFAFAAVRGSDKNVLPVALLEVSDRDAASKKWPAIEQCVDKQQKATSVKGGAGIDHGYLVLSDTVDHAQQVVDGAKKHPLVDDANFKKWDAALGGRGIINAYVSKTVWQVVADQAPAQIKTALSSCGNNFDQFSGASATVRFGDHGLELAIAAGGLDQYVGAGTVGPALKRLPRDTALAFSTAVEPTLANDMMQSFKCGFDSAAGGNAKFDDEVQQFHDKTGISLPSDLQTLLGDSITLALGGDAPARLDDLQGPGDVPFALSIGGDGNKIQSAANKFLSAIPALSGGPTDMSADEVLKTVGLTQQVTGAAYTLGGSKAFLDSLGGASDLTTDPTFATAVPDWDKAVAVMFIRFDSKWRDAILAQVAADAPGAVSVARDNSAPITALGVESWKDSSGIHAVFKLATK